MLADSCDFVPAGLPGVITVAAADVTHDATIAYPWGWSNYGSCVDIWAPGVDIEGASPDCYECTAIFSGTSQATPLVSGLIAQYLSNNPTADAADVKRALQEQAAPNVLEVLGHPYDTTVHFFAQVCLADSLFYRLPCTSILPKCHQRFVPRSQCEEKITSGRCLALNLLVS
jgi:hypothetical protein